MADEADVRMNAEALVAFTRRGRRPVENLGPTITPLAVTLRARQGPPRPSGRVVWARVMAGAAWASASLLTAALVVLGHAVGLM